MSDAQHSAMQISVDGQMFEKTVTHIREHGYSDRFYRLTITYFDQGGFVYWTVVPPAGDPEWYPAEEETIVDRSVAEGTYEYRLKHGTLPD